MVLPRVILPSVHNKLLLHGLLEFPRVLNKRTCLNTLLKFLRKKCMMTQARGDLRHLSKEILCNKQNQQACNHLIVTSS